MHQTKLNHNSTYVKYTLLEQNIKKWLFAIQ